MPIRLPTRDTCPFCAYLDGTSPCAFVARTEHVAAFVNVRQYERGAMLVVPAAHLPTVFDLDPAILSAIYSEAARVGGAALRAFGGTGLNIYQNNGVDAGQSIPHHHTHVVPRYPTSRKEQIFHEADFAPVPLAAQHEIAALIRAAL